MKLSFQNIKIEAGLDEAGRGCLAGPVVAAAVILDASKDWSLMQDSKKLSETKRMLLREKILADSVAYGIGMASAAEIDQLNILNASFLAMHRAIDLLPIKPAFLAIDGNRFKAYKKLDFTCVIKGDSKLQNIAAASILAKTERDALMQRLHNDFPQYGWDQNKAYGTQKHREAIRKYGRSPHHRKSFRLREE